MSGESACRGGPNFLDGLSPGVCAPRQVTATTSIRRHDQDLGGRMGCVGAFGAHVQ